MRCVGHSEQFVDTATEKLTLSQVLPVLHGVSKVFHSTDVLSKLSSRYTLYSVLTVLF